MKKIMAFVMSAIVVLMLVPTVSAAEVATPWSDSSINIMELESFESGYPAGNVTTWNGFWSYNQEIKFPAVGGQIKNGQLMINANGSDAFLFNRASGAVTSTLLSQASGFGFYVKNNTKASFKAAFYACGDKAGIDNGEAMFYFHGTSATLVDMQGKATTLTTADDLISIPAGAKGILCSLWMILLMAGITVSNWIPQNHP